MSGNAAILSYTSLIFEASGSGLSTSISVIVIGVTQLIAGVLSVFTVDLIGRRPLLLLSLCGSIVFLSGMAHNFPFIGITVFSNRFKFSFALRRGSLFPAESNRNRRKFHTLATGYLSGWLRNFLRNRTGMSSVRYTIRVTSL